LDKLNDLKRELKDILTLKQHASTVSRLQKELERLKHEITSIEDELSGTGSTKTADDVQAELDAIILER
jgi:DNA repair protein RAD50